MNSKSAIIPIERIQGQILSVRGERVLLDSDLARLYDVPTKVLVQAVKRNLDRFPVDFMFQLTREEFSSLRSQIVTSKPGKGGRRYPPFAFTEHGVAMLSSVLNTERAVRVNIEIVRAFIQLRQFLATHSALARKLEAMEKKYDSQFISVFEAIRQLMAPPSQPKSGRIGFSIPYQSK